MDYDKLARGTPEEREALRRFATKLRRAERTHQAVASIAIEEFDGAEKSDDDHATLARSLHRAHQELVGEASDAARELACVVYGGDPVDVAQRALEVLTSYLGDGNNQLVVGIAHSPEGTRFIGTDGEPLGDLPEDLREAFADLLRVDMVPDPIKEAVEAALRDSSGGDELPDLGSGSLSIDGIGSFEDMLVLDEDPERPSGVRDFDGRFGDSA